MTKNLVPDRTFIITELEGSMIVNVSRYRFRNIPATGALVKAEDEGNEQIMME